MSYWEQLKYLRLFSHERRRERYRIIYIWKILEGLVPNIQNLDGCDTVVAKLSDRRGRMCIPPPICRNASASAKTLRDGSLPVRVQQLFKCLGALLTHSRES